MQEAAIVEVPFYDGVLAGVVADGEVLFALKPICEALGIDYEAQRQRVVRVTWARSRLIHTTCRNGKRYRMTCVDRATFVMWLLTLNADRLRPDARAQIHRYQRACADSMRTLTFEMVAAPPVEYVAKKLFVYFFHDVAASQIKIGSTGDVGTRVGGLESQSGRPLKVLGVVAGAGVVEERELHVKFAALRRRGEWFEAAPELLSYIREVAKPFRRAKLKR